MRSGVCFITSVLISLSVCAFGYDWSTNPGDGSEGMPYQISTPEELMSIGENAELLDKHFVLTNDIVFDPNNNPAHVFTEAVIAADIPDSDPYSFTGLSFNGSIDGQNHRINNLKIVHDSKPFLGLFGSIGSGGLVSNLVLDNMIVRGHQYLGGLAGLNSGTLRNCHSSGTIETSSSAWYLGGLVGFNSNGIIIDCSSECAVMGGISSCSKFGGLVGGNSSGTLKNCKATGSLSNSMSISTVGGLVGTNSYGIIDDCYASVNLDNALTLGGLVGLNNHGQIINSFATGNITGVSTLGGLVGSNTSGTVRKCYATGTVTGSDSILGGLIGKNNNGTVLYSYATGSVYGTGSDSSDLGGLIGLNEGNIRFCVAQGDVEGSINSSYLGGLVGYCKFSEVQNCYTTGNVTGGNNTICIAGVVGYSIECQVQFCYEIGIVKNGSYRNGIVGARSSSATSVTDCYFREESLNIGYIPLFDGHPLSDSEMKLRISYANWDFVGEDVNGRNNIWRMCADGVEYPKLSWEFAKNGDFACGDGVDLDDLAALAAEWLSDAAVSPETFNTACDANGDEVINLADFDILSQGWE